MTLNLYELTNDLRKIHQWFDEAENNPELLTVHFYQVLDEVTLKRDQKLEGCRKVLADFEAEQEAIAYEIKRLEQRRNRIQKRHDTLSGWVAKNLLPGEEFECPIGGFSWRKSEYLDFQEGATIPKAYQRVKIEPDKKAITAAIKAGKKIKGWFLATRNNLQIK